MAADTLGYSGVYLSDHLFNPRELTSRYTYSKAPDGAPFWEKETAWPDPMCLISALSAVTTNLTFTTGIYIAPVRDLITVAKTVGTAAVLSGNRVRLGVGVGLVQGGVRPDRPGLPQPGQAARRHDPGPPGARGRAAGSSTTATHYDVPDCQMNPAPTEPIPIIGGGDSGAGPAPGRPPCATDGSTPGPPHPTRPSPRSSGHPGRRPAGRPGRRATSPSTWR